MKTMKGQGMMMVKAMQSNSNADLDVVAGKASIVNDANVNSLNYVQLEVANSRSHLEDVDIYDNAEPDRLEDWEEFVATRLEHFTEASLDDADDALVSADEALSNILAQKFREELFDVFDAFDDVDTDVLADWSADNDEMPEQAHLWGDDDWIDDDVSCHDSIAAC